jgi:hypothetical protein
VTATVAFSASDQPEPTRTALRATQGSLETCAISVKSPKCRDARDASIGLCLQPASVGFGSVWVTTNNGRVLRIQPQR